MLVHVSLLTSYSGSLSIRLHTMGNLILQLNSVLETAFLAVLVWNVVYIFLRFRQENIMQIQFLGVFQDMCTWTRVENRCLHLLSGHKGMFQAVPYKPRNMKGSIWKHTYLSEFSLLCGGFPWGNPECSAPATAAWILPPREAESQWYLLVLLC